MLEGGVLEGEVSEELLQEYMSSLLGRVEVSCLRMNCRGGS